MPVRLPDWTIEELLVIAINNTADSRLCVQFGFGSPALVGSQRGHFYDMP